MTNKPASIFDEMAYEALTIHNTLLNALTPEARNNLPEPVKRVIEDIETLRADYRKMIL